MRDWLKEISTRKENNRKVLNESQLKLVKKVVNRVCEEIEDIRTGKVDNNREPLRWAMHGGPGTGKTHVIQIIKEELFENVLNWNTSVDFQIVAMQAVMADLLEGDTMRSTFQFLERISLHGQCSEAATNIWNLQKQSCNIDG